MSAESTPVVVDDAPKQTESKDQQAGASSGPGSFLVFFHFVPHEPNGEHIVHSCERMHGK